MKKYKNKNIIRDIAMAMFLLLSVVSFAQQDSLQLKRQYQKLVFEAQKDLQEDRFSQAEAKLREAISLQPNNALAKYNLGTAYYNRKLNNEAQLRFKQAAGIATDKKDKHRAYHNLGNTFMNQKNYKAAVEAYKNALRNNPKDDETRYNLALAKKLLEDQQKNGGGGNDNKDKNKDQKDKDNKNQNNDNKDNKDNKDKKDQKDQDQKDGDKKDNKDDQGKDKEDKKEGDKEKDKGKPDDKQGDQKNKKEGEDDKKQQKPIPGKLSPQQIKSILQAMNNEEKKIQKKINAKKEKGVKIKTDKDW